jgi:hypothetical protein
MIMCNGACVHLRMQIFRMRMAIIWECSDKQLLDGAFTAFKTKKYGEEDVVRLCLSPDYVVRIL